MKSIVTSFMVLFCCLVATQAGPLTTVCLDQDWMFSEAGTDQWLTATVPGTVHQDLIRQELLPDPFFGTNESKIQWVENKDWVYQTHFDVSAEQFKREGARLVFEGLDTYADVYLNDTLILSGDNMFVGYSVDVRNVIRKGDNKLRIYFHSPITKVLPQWKATGFDYPADNDRLDKKLSVFTRKAPYSYGWDWGIRMVTSGIWRPIMLHFFDGVWMEDLYVKQLSLTDLLAQLSNEIEYIGIGHQDKKAIITVECTLEGQSISTKSMPIIIKPGKNRLFIPMEIQHPQRWMPRGWGKPVLYEVTVSIAGPDGVIARQTKRIGLRTLRLVNEKDSLGQSFYFEVNGIPLYAKGANYIPSDALLPKVTTERYRELFQNITEANMNAIRVWGGGIYEDDRFYDLADENGILIWQDFMFACTTYPHDSIFMSRVKAEVEYNIKRLRNHACLALWCGNNEILEGMHYWDWDKQYTPEVYQGMFEGYDALFRVLLPQQVAVFDAGRSYIHGSPLSSNWVRPESWAFGDSHNWGVWYGKKTFESFDTDSGRFMSEFGFQSFPEMKTIATFATPEDYALESNVMNAHQKSSIGNAMIKTYMERDYIVPETFEDFVYVGLVLQGKGMRYGFEAQRRSRPYCMGTLYWQLNDSWPVVSWSGIDYYGNWKALHYEAKRAFEPILVSPVQRNDTLFVYLVSDELTDREQLRLNMQWKNFRGKVRKNVLLKTRLSANSSMLVYKQAVNELMTAEQRRNSYIQLTLTDARGNLLNEQLFFLNKTKDLDLQQPRIKVKTNFRAGASDVTLSTDKLAKDVFIEIPIQGVRFSDNFFDLQPGVKKKITITAPLLKKDSRIQLKINHLKQTY